MGSVRTYAYPMFLYLISFVTGIDPVQLSLGAATVQYILFLGSTIWLVTLIQREIPCLAYAILIGVLLNPFLLALIVETLTEGLTVTVCIILAALAIKVGKSEQTSSFILVLSIGSAVAALALMLRPANVTIFLAWFLAVVLTTPYHPVWRMSRMRISIGVTAGAILAVCVVLAPQIIYNVKVWGKFTAFPVCPLGDVQFAYGIVIWKYDTLVNGVTSSAWLHINPFLKGAITESSPWAWYFNHPIAGAVTVFAHVFNGFSITHLFTYIHELHPPYQLALNFFYWIIFLLGLLGAFRGLKQWWAEFASGGSSLYICAKVFGSLALSATVALNSLVPTEVRYNVIPIALLSVLGWHTLLTFRGSSRRQAVITAALCCGIAVSMVVLTNLMATLGTSTYPPQAFANLPATNSTTPCVIFNRDTLNLRNGDITMLQILRLAGT